MGLRMLILGEDPLHRKILHYKVYGENSGLTKMSVIRRCPVWGGVR